MATKLQDIIDLASLAPFQRKVRAAMIKAALAVGTEAYVEGSPRSQLRRSLSVNVFAALDDYTDRFTIAAAAVSTITHLSADADIETAVNAVWDTVAGAPPAA